MEIFEWTEQTPVTANNLNEMQNILNDKFNYTQEEQRIGTWIDGKPLYRKVCISTNVTINSKTTLESISSIKEVIKISAMVINSKGFSVPIQTIWSNDLATQGNKIWVDVGSSNGTVKYELNSWWTNITKIIVILEYTKTTD